MALETASYVGGLVGTNPTATDPKSQGDDHLRLVKTVLQNTFAGFPGMAVVTGSEAQGASVNDYTLTLSPAPAAYTWPLLAAFKATHANTGAATVQIGALGTKPLIAVDGTALKSGDIESGGLVAVFYDGTSFVLISGNDRANRNGETYSGTHNFTGASQVALPANTGIGSVSAAELAVLDGLTASTAELNTLDGVTASAAEINVLNGITVSTADLNSVVDRAPQDSPTFTGAPHAPTPAIGSNDTSIATTAFVQRDFAKLDSPAFVGNPTAPTPALGVANNQIATTDFVSAFALTSGPVPGIALWPLNII